MTAPGAAASGDALSVLLAGGGSAGHVSPMLALADALVRRDPATRITALGTAEGLEARLVPQRGYRLVTVPKVPLPRRPGMDLLRVPGRLKGAVDAAAGEALVGWILFGDLALGVVSFVLIRWRHRRPALVAVVLTTLAAAARTAR